MNKLAQVFSKGKAFIPYLVAGDPSAEVTEKMAIEMGEAGVDLIELGIPFSDPTAEGPVIERAHQRALASGIKTDDIFKMLRSIREESNVPVALMTYANPVFTYGPERFMFNCHEVGVDAIIVPDMPFEERGDFLPFCAKYGIGWISLISPTSKERIRLIAQEAQGFIYCISSLGVTGMREKLSGHAVEMIKKIKEIKNIPCAIGFGISNEKQAARLAEFADGVIIGSAIVKIIEEYGEGCPEPVMGFVRGVLAAIK